MKRNIRVLFGLIESFGMLQGIKIFTNIKIKNFKDLKLPNYKSPITLRKNTSDVTTFLQVFVNRDYELKYTQEPKVIIDGGANIGLFTLLMKNKFPNSKIISVEPDKDNFEVLQKNVLSYNDVYCENSGLWNKATNLKIYDKFELGKWGMVVEESDHEGTISAITINDIISKYSIDKVDILKIDIETSEKIVFSNNYENWLPKVKMIIIELHDFIDEDCSKPFFLAINKTFNKYQYLTHGENTVIINNDLN